LLCNRTKIKEVKRIVLVTALFAIASIVKAQPIISLNGNATISIEAGAIVAMDGLVLKPSANYTLSNANNLQKSATLTHPAAGTHINRVYYFSQAVSPFTGQVRFYYAGSELNGIAENQLALNVYNGSIWNVYPPVSVDTDSNFVETNVTSLVIWESTLAQINAALPLHWVHVSAALTGEDAEVKWITANEYNVAGFRVEKKVNDQWVSISNLLPAQNTAGPNTYTFVDYNLSNGAHSYRVMQEDIDGKRTYSQVVLVKLNRQEKTKLAIYPNPASDYFTVSSTDGSILIKNIRLINSSGVIVSYINAGNKTAYQVKLSHLSAGTYIVQIEDSNGDLMNSKLIKQ
jgi:hypothetical protein